MDNQDAELTWVLSLEDQAKADRVAHARQERSRKKGRRPGHGFAGDPEAQYRIHSLGARGELAAARILGLDWPAHVDTFKTAPDLYPNLEVRTVSGAGERRLIVRNDDPPDRLYLLVEEVIGEYRLLGAIRGSMARRDEWRTAPNDREEAWFVPREALRRILPRRPDQPEPEPPPAKRPTPPGKVQKGHWDVDGVRIECHYCGQRITGGFTLVAVEENDPAYRSTSHWRAHKECAPDDQPPGPPGPQPRPGAPAGGALGVA